MKLANMIPKLWIIPLSIDLALLIGAGCATPPEVKTASRAQLELIGSLDEATAALADGLTGFHQEQQARIRAEGRVLIARQAISVAAADTNATTTADGLFKVSNEKIRPWVDYALAGPEIDVAINKLTNRIAQASDAFLKGSLQFDLEDLNLLKATLSRKPNDVRQLEAIIQADLDQEKETIDHDTKVLQLLKAQLGLMKIAATTVDDWLTIDLTLSQEQADKLKQAFADATTALDKGGK